MDNQLTLRRKFKDKKKNILFYHEEMKDIANVIYSSRGKPT